MPEFSIDPYPGDPRAEDRWLKDHGWARVREERVQFSDLRVRRAAEFIDTCGIADELQALLAKSTGRPRLCTVKGLLVGMALCSRRNANGAVYFNQVTDILHWGIPERWRREFNLAERPDNSAGFEAGYSVVLRLFRALLAALDPSPLPKNKRLPKDQAYALEKAADKKMLQHRRELLVRLTNKIIEASLASVKHRMRDIWDGSLGVDATPIATFARGVYAKDAEYTSTDPDAGLYAREADHRVPAPEPAQAANGKGRRRKLKDKKVWGYDATLAVARNPHHDPAPCPTGAAIPPPCPR